MIFLTPTISCLMRGVDVPIVSRIARWSALVCVLSESKTVIVRRWAPMNSIMSGLRTALDALDPLVPPHHTTPLNLAGQSTLTSEDGACLDQTPQGFRPTEPSESTSGAS
jgi:hypothetical protein